MMDPKSGVTTMSFLIAFSTEDGSIFSPSWLPNESVGDAICALSGQRSLVIGAFFFSRTYGELVIATMQNVLRRIVLIGVQTQSVLAMVPCVEPHRFTTLDPTGDAFLVSSSFNWLSFVEAQAELVLAPDHCPQGHRLVEFQTTHAGFVCDQCQRSCELGTLMSSCRECDFDVCFPYCKSLANLSLCRTLFGVADLCVNSRLGAVICCTNGFQVVRFSLSELWNYHKCHAIRVPSESTSSRLLQRREPRGMHNRFGDLAPLRFEGSSQVGWSHNYEKM